MSKVRIVEHPETGKLFTETSNPEFFKCQVTSKEVVVSKGVVAIQKRVAFPLISKEVTELYSELKDGDNFPIPGKITRMVTDYPQYEGHEEVVNPSTGETMGYYHTYTFTSDLDAFDKDLRGIPQETTPAELESVKKESLERVTTL